MTEQNHPEITIETHAQAEQIAEAITAITKKGNIATIAYGKIGCRIVKETKPDGSVIETTECGAEW